MKLYLKGHNERYPVEQLQMQLFGDRPTQFVETPFSGEDGAVLGMHIIGPRATDLISEGALAIRMGASVEDLITTIHSHPTVSEAVREAALNVEKRAIHTRN